MGRILVVDDDRDILELVDLLLTIKGFTVRSISKAERIVDEIKSFGPDLILLDVNLSGYDGRKICKELKAAGSAFKDIPVILFSAMHDLKFQSLECDASDFVQKPFDTTTLLEKIKKHVRKAAA